MSNKPFYLFQNEQESSIERPSRLLTSDIIHAHIVPKFIQSSINCIEKNENEIQEYASNCIFIPFYFNI